MLGSDRAWVVHGADGIDEMSTTGHTKVSECRNGAVSTFYVHPSDFGLPKAERKDLQGGDAAANAAILRDVFAGEQGTAPRCRAAQCRRLVVRRRKGGIGARRDRARRAGHRLRALPREARRDDRGIEAGDTHDVDGRRHRICSPLSSPPRSEWSRCEPRRCRSTSSIAVRPRVEPRPGRFRGRAVARGSRERHCRVQTAVALARRAEGRLRSGGDCDAATNAPEPRRFPC